jgi:alcohol dehydrogenase
MTTAIIPSQSNKLNGTLAKNKDTTKTMKGLVYEGLGKIEWKEVPKPSVDKPTDAPVKIIKKTIFGTDLGILHGKTPSVKSETTLGCEGIGVIEEVDTSVSNFKEGNKVINGTQAEYVRIPHADNSLYAAPEGIDEEAPVMLSDILSTGHETGVINGCINPGDTIAIVGAGPIGMSALLTAQFHSPAKIYMIDLDANRLKLAEKLGATHIINLEEEDAIKKIMSETKDGVDVAIEAVGATTTFDICQQIVRPGGFRQYLGSWSPCRPSNSGLMDSKYHYHDGFGQNQHHAYAAKNGGVGKN